MNERKYYVVKVTIEDEQQTEQIIPHNTERAALIDFHNVFGGTILYDSVKVCTMLIINDYGTVIRQDRYERNDVVPEGE